MIERLRDVLEGRYRIERELGAGGMATVYLADDLKHGRKVALKVLRPELAAVMGAERFLSEIRTTANLQHPHILPLFDSGQADGLLWYAMPYIEGESLRDRLDREKQLPVDEAVKIATKVAGALQVAHDRGIIHRDIKPANILLANGEPLVADFGIALAVGQAGGGRLTETGLSLGTPFYMSPEQATGDQLPDGRSDVYALAAVTYESLTGEPPFTGSTAQAVLSKILTGEVRPVTQYRKSVPANVEAALTTALERTPADRFATPSAFAAALADPGYRRERASAAGATRAGGGSGRAVLIGVSGLALGLVLGGLLDRDPSEDGPRDYGLPTEGRMIGAGLDAVRTFTVSPDGAFIVYGVTLPGTGDFELWRLDLPTGQARALPGTRHSGVGTVHVSPDGRRIAFQDRERGELRIVSSEGGQPAVVSDNQEIWAGEWQEDGTIVFTDNDGRYLRWVHADRGPVRDLAVGYCQLPRPFSDGEIICGGGSDKFARVIRTGDDDPTLRPVLQRTGSSTQPLRGTSFRVVDDDYLVYMSIDATVTATRILDRDSLIVGPSIPLVPGVRRAAYTGDGHFNLTRDGTLVYAPGVDLNVQELVLTDLEGRTELFLPEPAAHLRFNVSPDGTRLASVIDGVRGQELRLYDIASGGYRELVEGEWISTPFWAADGDAIVYSIRHPTETRIDRYDLTSSGPEMLTALPVPEGQLIDYQGPTLMLVAARGRPIYVADATRFSALVDSLGTAGTYFAAVSPDRSLVVWRDMDEGVVYLQPWPERDRRWSVARGSFEPYWLPDGDMVLHSHLGSVRRVEIQAGGSPPFDPPEHVFDHPRRGDTPGWSNSITSDGRMISPWVPDQPYVTYFRVVPGWVDEMKAAVDAGTP